LPARYYSLPVLVLRGFVPHAILDLRVGSKADENDPAQLTKRRRKIVEPERIAGLL
jgi:hypothetical protein